MIVLALIKQESGLVDVLISPRDKYRNHYDVINDLILRGISL